MLFGAGVLADRLRGLSSLPTINCNTLLSPGLSGLSGLFGLFGLSLVRSQISIKYRYNLWITLMGSPDNPDNPIYDNPDRWITLWTSVMRSTVSTCLPTPLPLMLSTAENNRIPLKSLLYKVQMILGNPQVTLITLIILITLMTCVNNSCEWPK